MLSSVATFDIIEIETFVVLPIFDLISDHRPSSLIESKNICPSQVIESISNMNILSFLPGIIVVIRFASDNLVMQYLISSINYLVVK